MGEPIRSRWSVPAIAALIISSALTLAALKAANAAITTDEAWNFNRWISSGPLFIWSDFSRANNHVLHSLLAWVSTRCFGTTELALRLPALCGFGMLLISTWLLSGLAIRRVTLRLLLLASTAYLPYLIDFAACARGYSLGVGFYSMALYQLCRILGRDRPSKRARVVRLAIASASLGLAIGSVPVMATLCLGTVLVFLFLQLNRGYGATLRTAGLLALPAALVLFAVYGRVLDDISSDIFWFGSESLESSLTSLHAGLVYTTPTLVDDKGYPLLTESSPSWQPGLLTESFEKLLWQPAVFWILLGMLLLILWCGLRLSGEPRKHSNALLVWGFVMGLGLLSANVQLLGFAWPLHRTWIPYIPSLLLASYIALDTLADIPRSTGRTVVKNLILGGSIIFLVNSILHIRLDAYREWIDNAPVKQVIQSLAETNTQKRIITIGYPFYQEACFIYYKNQDDLDWLRLPRNNQTAEDPVWEYMLINSRMDPRYYQNYRVIESFERFQVELRQRDEIR